MKHDTFYGQFWAVFIILVRTMTAFESRTMSVAVKCILRSLFLGSSRTTGGRMLTFTKYSHSMPIYVVSIRRPGNRSPTSTRRCVTTTNFKLDRTRKRTAHVRNIIIIIAREKLLSCTAVMLLLSGAKKGPRVCCLAFAGTRATTLSPALSLFYPHSVRLSTDSISERILKNITH